jgi:desulfoferrodoxin (superoxide reductase-like protein)
MDEINLIKMKKSILISFLFVFLAQAGLLANKTSVKVNVPSEVKNGSEITLTINVFHNGNSKMHHTEWVYLKINGVEVKRWQYDKNNLPPDGNFTVEYKYVITRDATIEVEGNCNLHGTTGPFKTTIKVN